MNTTGNVVNAHDHYPFGKRMPARHMVTDAEGNRYQYTGHEFDEETGYGYHGARYYNRELGRYMNVDRYAEKFYGQSPYVYAGDMPIVAVDVNGDSIVIDDKGYLLRADRDGDGNLTDKLVFMRTSDDSDLEYIGELTKTVTANSWYTNLINQNELSTINMGLNAFKFRTAVEKNGKWDYKNLNRGNPDIGNNQKFPHILGLAFELKKDTKFDFDGQTYRSEDLNNHHFGYVAKAFGFSEYFALNQAGKAEMGKWKEEGKEVPIEWRPTQDKPSGTVLLSPYGDNPTDQIMIKRGFKRYDSGDKTKPKGGGSSW